MKTLSAVVALPLILLLLASCGEDNMLTTERRDYGMDFDSVWINFDLKYPLFSYKGVDWDGVAQEYGHRFEMVSLEERDAMLAEALGLFRDAHIVLVSPAGTRRNTYSPPRFRVNYNERFLSAFRDSVRWRRESDAWGWGIRDSIGYMEITRVYGNLVDISAFDRVLDSLENTRGLIIDLRRVSGGSLSSCRDIWNRFCTEEAIVGYQRYRNGPGHDDFAAPLPVTARPAGRKPYTRQVMLLIGRNTKSAGEILAETLSGFARITLIGDTTLGAVVAPASFELSDGTRYTLPIVAYLDAEMRPLEGRGVAPDVYIDPRRFPENETRDAVLEEAFARIH